MLSVVRRKLWAVAILAVLFILWPARAVGNVSPRATPGMGGSGGEARPTDEARARLVAGFQQILDYFQKREFSLLRAWREMRDSGDPRFFERAYPAVSKELDAWAAVVESRYGVADDGLDLSFIAETFGPLVFDERASEIMRDNALGTVCMVCAMDALRCDQKELHRFLATVVAEDASAARKAEALRWWRRSGGVIDEALLQSVLASSAGSDLDLRTEAAKVLFSASTRRSLSAQRLLVGTSGLPADPTDVSTQIACTAIDHIARARYEDGVPEILEALGDPSLGVRACAAEAMGDLSGQRPAFDAAAAAPGAPGNAEAIERWQAWWSGRGGGQGAPSR